LQVPLTQRQVSIALPAPGRTRTAVLAGLSLGASALVVSAILLALSVDPISAAVLIGQGAFGDPFAISETFVQMTPLLLAGLGVAVAFRAGLWNIGAEGQLYAGAIGAVLVGLNLLHLPSFSLLVMALVAGALAGALWGLIPALLKVKFGAQEVLVTIMLNYIALLASSMVISGPWHDPIVPKTRDIDPAAMLPVLVPGTRLHLGVPLALVAAVVIFAVMNRSVLGYRIRAVGFSRDAARLAGIHVNTVTVVTFCISGALAGLAGATLVMGIHHALVDGLSPGYGYTAIAVALLGRLHPLWVVLSAVIFAALYVGTQSMQIVTGLPSDFVLVIQSVLLLSILAARLIDVRG
jgi:general nucleoside transport system permease protein